MYLILAKSEHYNSGFRTRAEMCETQDDLREFVEDNIMDYCDRENVQAIIDIVVAPGTYNKKIGIYTIESSNFQNFTSGDITITCEDECDKLQIAWVCPGYEGCTTASLSL